MVPLPHAVVDPDAVVVEPAENGRKYGERQQNHLISLPKTALDGENRLKTKVSRPRHAPLAQRAVLRARGLHHIATAAVRGEEDLLVPLARSSFWTGTIFF